MKDQTIFSGCLCLSCDHLNHMDCIRANCKCCVMDATQYKKVVKKIKIKSKNKGVIYMSPLSENATDPAQNSCRNWDDHDFREVYYGHECKNCGLFFAFGCAPWDADDPNQEI